MSENNITFAFDMETGEIVVLKNEQKIFTYKSLEGPRIIKRIDQLFKKAVKSYELHKTYH